MLPSWGPTGRRLIPINLRLVTDKADATIAEPPVAPAALPIGQHAPGLAGDRRLLEGIGDAGARRRRQDHLSSHGLAGAPGAWIEVAARGEPAGAIFV